MKKVVLILMLMLSIIALGETKEEPIEPNFKPYIFNLKQLRITWLDGSINSGDKVEIRIYDNMNLEENENFKREEFIESWSDYYDITYNFNYGEDYFIKITVNNKKTYLLKTNAYSGKPLDEQIFLFKNNDNYAFNKVISKKGLFIATTANGKLRIRNMKGHLISEFSGFTEWDDDIKIEEFNPNKEEELFIIDNKYKKITVVNILNQNVIEDYDNRGVEIEKVLFSDNIDYFVTVEKKNGNKVFSLWKRGNKNAKFTKTGNNFTIIKCFKDYILYLEGDNIMKCDFEGNSSKLFSIERYKPRYCSFGNGISDGVYNENKRTFLLSFDEKIYEIDLTGNLLNNFTLKKYGIPQLFGGEYYNEQFIENGDKLIICEENEAYIFDTEKYNLINILDEKYWDDEMEVSDNGIVLSGDGTYNSDIKLSVFY